jgi:glycosyltransferase involved in cell wall biosynthesis
LHQMDYQSFLKNFQIKPVIIHQDISDQKPLASICILTYQHVNYIKQCLDGILMQQTTFPFEILLGEDASSDGTREICLEYAANHPDKIRLFLHHRENNIAINGTPTGRFNFLYNLYNARGKYIAICEGDDYWTDPLKLQKQVDFLEGNKKYNYCGHKSCVKKNEHIKKIVLDVEILTFKELIFKNRLNTSSLVFRRESISHFPDFFYTLSAGDWALQLLAIKGSNAYVLDEYMSVYRLHNGGIWSTLDNQTMCRQGVQIMNAFKEIYNDKKSIKLIEAAINERKKSFGLINQSYIKSILQKLNIILKSTRRNKPNIALRIIKKLKSILKF